MLNKHFREFIELLENREVEYLVVGGYAVGVHGFPRYTGDFDVFVALSEGNAEKILQSLAEFGFADLGLTGEDFLEPDVVVEIGRAHENSNAHGYRRRDVRGVPKGNEKVFHRRNGGAFHRP